MPRNETELRTYFSNVLQNGGEAIVNEFILQGFNDEQGLQGLWEDRAEMKALLPGLDGGQYVKARMALKKLFED